MTDDPTPVCWFEELRRADVPRVGGKNASLGEMIANLSARGVRVPPGFATTAGAYRRFVAHNGLGDVIAATMASLAAGKLTLAEAGQTIRRAFLAGDWPADTAEAIRSSYRELCRRAGRADIDVAVRSSATAEDLPDASFAGQQESFLNIHGERALIDACRRCYASLFTDRAISYRDAKGFDHLKVALSVGVQRMVRSDLGGAGVMFTLDTETGFDKVVLIDAAWGLGENVVQGTVDPDAYRVFKPLLSDPSLTPIIEKTCGAKARKLIYADDQGASTRNVPTSKAERAGFVLTDPEILSLSRWACVIEDHYGCPMDIEWAKDGETGELFVVQARPETVQSRRGAGTVTAYRVTSKGRTLATGLGIGEAVATGRVCVIEDARRHRAFRRRLGAGHPHHRPGLGAGHEAGGGDRHRPRRAHLARRHRQPRAGAAGHRRHRRRHPGPARRAGGHGVLRRGRPGPCLRGLRRGRGGGGRPRRHPGDPHQGDAQPRQPGGGLPLVAAACRRRRPGADGVRGLQPGQGAPDGAGPLRHPGRPGSQARDRRR